MGGKGGARSTSTNAKKRKYTGLHKDLPDSRISKKEASRKVARDQPEDSNTAAGSSRVKNGSFCIRSSKNVPFLVVSDRQLVDGLPSPSPAEWQELLALCREIIKMWDAKGRGTSLLADFEGEMTGLEGELVSAAFQRTLVLDPKSLRPTQVGGGGSREMGLLVDLRCADAIQLVKRIMESENMCKIIWGANGDVTSLRYTPVQQPLSIESSNVVDAQLAFSNHGRRLGMEKMLERLPPKSIEGLPAKACIDFATPHAFNRRALALPFQPHVAAYAVDDLHRLEAVLLGQKPSSGNYSGAQKDTSSLHVRLMQNPVACAVDSLAAHRDKFTHKGGLDGQLAAVRAKRRILAVRRLFPTGMDAAVQTELSAIEAEVDRILSEVGVVVPEDLSFAATVPSEEATTSKVDSGKLEPAIEKEGLETMSDQVTDGTAPHPKKVGKKRKIMNKTTKGAPQEEDALSEVRSPQQVDQSEAVAGPRASKIKTKKQKVKQNVQ